MPSTLPAPEAKAAAVRAMFDRIAPRYDRMNGLMTGGQDDRWRRRLVAAIGAGPDDIVLDLACGTGDFLAIVGERSRQLVGVDFSGKMLKRARDRGPGKTGLAQADALRLPLRDASVTRVFCGFALRNFAAIPPVLAELARVVAPGGRLGMLEVDRPDNGLVRAAHRVYFNRVVPFIGGLVSDARAYRYLPESVVYLPPAAELIRMFKVAGFKDVERERFMCGAIQTLVAVRE